MSASLPIRAGYFRPGERVAVAVSGGADSVALLRVLAATKGQMGLVLSVVHVHHGIRGADADADQSFVEALARSLEIPVRTFSGDARARAAEHKETLEEAARELRYHHFRALLHSGEADSVATAHTEDDQAETVLMKLLRGAWTEGLGGISPVVATSPGRIVRPLLRTSRAEVEQYLRALGQEWREDASNADRAFTRNRTRHELLPALAGFNPQIARQLGRLAAVAQEEEAWWQGELARVLPSLLLPGRATRGGGRATSTHPEAASLAIEVERLRSLHPALRRRVLRGAGAQMGANLSFDQVEALLDLAGMPGAGIRVDGSEAVAAAKGTLTFPGGLRAERTPREVRLLRAAGSGGEPAVLPEYPLPVPGSIAAPEYGIRVLVEQAGEVSGADQGKASGTPPAPAVLRSWQPGDRVTLQHSRGPKKVAEVLDRLRVYGPDRAGWPVIVQGRQVLWMRGAAVDPAALQAAGLRILVEIQS